MKRKILEFFLLPLARLIIKRYRPVIIAITGSVGKTSTKDAVAAVLSRKYSVWKTKNNLNTDIGLCLTIIGGENAKGSVLGWLKNFWGAVLLAVRRSPVYPRYLVLEMGADHPGDLTVLTRLVKPSGSIVTAIGEIPVHVSNYLDIEDVVREKQKILEAISSQGWVILNADDERVSTMKFRPDLSVFTFGFSESALVRVVDYTVHVDGDGAGSGIYFRLQYQGSSVPVRCSGVLGRPYAYACAAAAACGAACGINLVDIATGLGEFIPEKGRMKVIAGANKSILLDDSYNAAPAAMRAAIETLGDCKYNNRRLIGVLGDMLELGKYAEQAHRAVGKQAVAVCDILFLVGENMKFALDEAGLAKFPEKNLFYIQDSGSVPELLLPLLSENDIVLIKGSQGMRMEKITGRVMADPSLAAGLLVRQTREWQVK